MLRKFYRENSRKIFVILLLLNGFFWISYNSISSRELEIYFLDIGQGDSILIVTPDNYRILVDGGPDSDTLSQVDIIVPFWDRTIDLAVLTHPDLDHVGGYPELLRYYDIEHIMYPGVIHNSYAFSEFENQVQFQEIEVLDGFSENNYRVGCCVFINTLWPENETNLETSDVNDASIAFELIYGNTRFFFGGDLSQKYEDLLLDNDSWLRANLLKVGHHGSKTSTSSKFVQRLSPEVAVISAGEDNKFGHPHDEVLKILKSQNIDVLRTDELGTIKVESDGEEIYY